MNEVKNWAYRNLKGDPVIWFIVLILSLFSILVVYSATGSLAYKMMDGNTEYYLIKHSVLVIVSLGAIWLAHRIDYRYYSKISRLVLWLCVPLLLFTWMFGTNINEASRWLTIPVINQAFQPSDLAKLALLVTLASMLSKRQQSIDDFQKAIVPMLFWIGLICGLIALTNFSSAILLFLTCMLVLFIGRVPMKYLGMLVVICASFGSVAFMVGQRGGTAISRVEDYINNDTPYQAKQAYIAIASGGVIGKGPGQSDQRNFLPHPYSDFIYAIILEEYGMIGGVLILFLYLALLYRGMKAAEQNDRAYGGLLSAGLSFALVVQALVNMGVAVGLGPVTGLTLPFISMGGTSQLFAGVALGIILSVSRGEIDNFGGAIGNQYKEAA
ncbi:cell division protein FtsW [Ekhidna lutea]|uniref:Probable peptidoglycan glycosyltransferase FtsW n=1 Tax=Ekhidna lutea TaxID=447679 RepID=A0A239L0N8_EKHLU|nr:FtsW/RodA/SpoVE family cell cycle protein [Ekhidna lutea]SNT24147.1 cell division protein FtsW [Ekhidna lutea]